MDTLKKLNSIMILSLEVCHFIVQFKVGKEGRILGLLTIRILRQVTMELNLIKGQLCFW